MVTEEDLYVPDEPAGISLSKYKQSSGKRIRHKLMWRRQLLNARVFICV